MCIDSSIDFVSLTCQVFVDRWICIYPAYINSKKSRQEGRKIRKDLCVENPTFQEIKDVLSVSNLRIGIENKLYPREKSKVICGRAKWLVNEFVSPFHVILSGTPVSWPNSRAIEKRRWNHFQSRVPDTWQSLATFGHENSAAEIAPGRTIQRWSSVTGLYVKWQQEDERKTTLILNNSNWDQFQ